MRKIKNYQEFTNEEINLKKALSGAALGASLALSSPSISQTTQPQQIGQNINKQVDTKISGWEGLKWGDSIDIVMEKFPDLREHKSFYRTEGTDTTSLTMNNYKFSLSSGDSIVCDVFIYFDLNKKLKSVELNMISESSNFKKVKNYLNSNYWQANSTEDRAFWSGELGDITLTEKYETSSAYSTGYATSEYNTKLVISKSNKNFDMSQLTDSQKFEMLRNELINMKNDQTEVKLNLYKCHKEFKVGVGLAGAGLGLGILGTALIKDDSEIGKPVAIIGSVLSLAGSIVIIDSHKFIGRASLTGIKINIQDEKKPTFDKVQPGDYFLYMGPGQ
jgi:hypothetical protein